MKKIPLLTALGITAVMASGCTILTTDYSYRYGHGYNTWYSSPSVDVDIYDWGYYGGDHRHHGSRYDGGRRYGGRGKIH